MTINTELLDKALSRIVEAPERWNQNSYIGVPFSDRTPAPDDLCKTTLCLAGWVMVESGQWKPAIVDGEPALVNADGEPPAYDDSSGLGSYGAVGQKLLGLSREQAKQLFLYTSRTDDPQEFVDYVRRYLGVRA